MTRFGWFFLALWLTTTLAPQAAQAALTVTLRATAEAPGDFIYLDEVAAVSGAPAERVRIDRAPLPGYEKRLTARQVSTALRRELGRQAEFSVSGEAVVVRRATATLTGAEIIAAAADALRRQFAQFSRVEITPAGSPPADLTVFASGMTLVPQVPGPATGGRTTVRVAILHDGSPLRVVAVVFTVTPYATVAIAGRAWERGDIIDPAQVQFAERAMPNLRGAPVTTAEMLAGKRATRLILSDGIITADMLEAVPVIARGEEVTVTVLRGGVNISTRARAREEGFRGDTIKLTNLDSGKLITAEVTAPGNVVIR